jgi:hypothetical protein
MFEFLGMVFGALSPTAPATVPNHEDYLRYHRYQEERHLREERPLAQYAPQYERPSTIWVSHCQGGFAACAHDGIVHRVDGNPN